MNCRPTGVITTMIVSVILFAACCLLGTLHAKPVIPLQGGQVFHTKKVLHEPWSSMANLNQRLLESMLAENNNNNNNNNDDDDPNVYTLDGEAGAQDKYQYELPPVDNNVNNNEYGSDYLDEGMQAYLLSQARRQPQSWPVVDQNDPSNPLMDPIGGDDDNEWINALLANSEPNKRSHPLTKIPMENSKAAKAPLQSKPPVTPTEAAKPVELAKPSHAKFSGQKEIALLRPADLKTKNEWLSELSEVSSVCQRPFPIRDRLIVCVAVALFNHSFIYSFVARCSSFVFTWFKCYK